MKTMGVGTMALCFEQRFAQASESLRSGAEVPAGSTVPVDLNVNQSSYRLFVEARWTLLFVLREKLGLPWPGPPWSWTWTAPG